MKKILVSLMAILLAVGLVGAGAFAYFSDTETSTGNSFTAGTLDLKVDDTDNPNLAHIVVSNKKPGDIEWIHWTLKNVGSIPGKVSVEFSPITNNENGVNEPEAIAEAKPWGTQVGEWGPRTTLGGPDGELGEYLIAALQRDQNNALFVVGNMGPPHGTELLGLNGWGGKTFDMGVTLGQGQTQEIWISLRLESNLRASYYGNSHDVDDNVIQSDGVVFNIIFHLDQVH